MNSDGRVRKRRPLPGGSTTRVSVTPGPFRVGSTIDRADWARDQLDRARQILDHGLPDDGAAAFLASLANATSFMATPIVSGAVVQDLVSTGNLRLIRDPDVRGAILSMDAVVRGRITITAQAESEVASGLEPLVARFLPPNAISRPASLRGAEVVVDTSSVSTEEILRAARGIAADPRFLQELNAEYRRVQRGRETSESLRSTLEGYAERLAAMTSAGTA